MAPISKKKENKKNAKLHTHVYGVFYWFSCYQDARHRVRYSFEIPPTGVRCEMLKTSSWPYQRLLLIIVFFFFFLSTVLYYRQYKIDTKYARTFYYTLLDK